MAEVAPSNSLRVVVLGGGSWGTSLAIRCAANHPVTLWVRSPKAAEKLQQDRENHKYLPGVELPAGVEVTASLEAALARAETIPGRRAGQGAGQRRAGQGAEAIPDRRASVVILAVPADAVRAVVEQAAPLLRALAEPVTPESPRSGPGPGANTVLVSAAKGFEAKTHLRMSEVVAEVLGRHGQTHRLALATLSGPCFAAELARGVVTAAVVASYDIEVAQRVQFALASETFRLYASSDVVGVEIGGAVKNVIAIAAGCVDGVGAGLNTRAALITRGLAEMARLAGKLGGDPRTLAGLAGLGDLMLTCTGDLSRNRRFGYAVGQGHTPAEALALVGQVVEGMGATQAAFTLGKQAGVDLPITEQVHRVLFDGATPNQVLRDLMQRALKDELG